MATGRNYFRQLKIQVDLTDRQTSEEFQKRVRIHTARLDQQGYPKNPPQDDRGHRPVLRQGRSGQIYSSFKINALTEKGDLSSQTSVGRAIWLSFGGTPPKKHPQFTATLSALSSALPLCKVHRATLGIFGPRSGKTESPRN